MTTQQHVMWTHGHSVQAQSPDQLLVQRHGFFTRIGKAKVIDTTYWFHFAIPTPTLVGNEPLGVKSATIRFRTSADSGGKLYQEVRVVSVHVYDSEAIIGQYDGLDLKPPNWQNATVEYSLPKDLAYGLGISVGVEFVGERSSKAMEQGYIDFSGAGAVFVDPRLTLARKQDSVLYLAKHPELLVARLTDDG